MIPEKAQQKVNEAVVIAVGPGARNKVHINITLYYIKSRNIGKFSYLEYLEEQMANRFFITTPPKSKI